MELLKLLSVEKSIDASGLQRQRSEVFLMERFSWKCDSMILDAVLSWLTVMSICLRVFALIKWINYIDIFYLEPLEL